MAIFCLSGAVSYVSAKLMLYSVYFASSKEKNEAFPSPHSPCNIVPLFKLLVEKQQTPQLWMKERGVGVDCFVLWNYSKLHSKTVYQQFGHQL